MSVSHLTAINDMNTNRLVFAVQPDVCLFWGTNWTFNNCLDDLQVTDRRPLTAEDRVQSQPSLCPICGEQEWHLDRFFSHYTPFPRVRNIPPMLHTRLKLKITLIRRTSGRSLGTFKALCSRKPGSIEQESTLTLLFRFRTVNLSPIVTPP